MLINNLEWLGPYLKRMYIIAICSNLIVLCNLSADEAIKNNNKYTIRHHHVNTTYFWLQIRWEIINLSISILKIDLPDSNSIMKILTKVSLMIIRFTIFVYVLVQIVFKEGLPLLFFIFNLDSNNWWINKNENFITNESHFNAAVCWIVWFILDVFNWICFLTIFSSVFGCVKICYEQGLRVSFTEAYKMASTSSKYLWLLFIDYI